MKPARGSVKQMEAWSSGREENGKQACTRQQVDCAQGPETCFIYGQNSHELILALRAVTWEAGIHKCGMAEEEKEFCGKLRHNGLCLGFQAVGRLKQEDHFSPGVQG